MRLNLKTTNCQLFFIVLYQKQTKFLLESFFLVNNQENGYIRINAEFAKICVNKMIYLLQLTVEIFVVGFEF